jgi:hypothetical protein
LGAERPGGAAQRLVSCRSSDSTRSVSIGTSVTLSAACFLDCCSRFAPVTNVEVIAAVMIARNADALGHHDGADELAGDGDDEGSRSRSRLAALRVGTGSGMEPAARSRRRNWMIGLAPDGAGLVLRSERALAGGGGSAQESGGPRLDRTAMELESCSLGVLRPAPGLRSCRSPRLGDVTPGACRDGWV